MKDQQEQNDQRESSYPRARYSCLEVTENCQRYGVSYAERPLWLSDHFSDLELYPLFVQIEWILSIIDTRHSLQPGYTLHNVRCKKPIFPHQKIQIEVKGHFPRFKFTISGDSHTSTTGTIAVLGELISGTPL